MTDWELIERARDALKRRDERERKRRHAARMREWRATPAGHESARLSSAKYAAAHPEIRAGGAGHSGRLPEQVWARERHRQVTGGLVGQAQHVAPILDDEGLYELAAVL